MAKKHLGNYQEVRYAAINPDEAFDLFSRKIDIVEREVPLGAIARINTEIREGYLLSLERLMHNGQVYVNYNAVIDLSNGMGEKFVDRAERSNLSALACSILRKNPRIGVQSTLEKREHPFNPGMSKVRLVKKLAPYCFDLKLDDDCQMSPMIVSRKLSQPTVLKARADIPSKYGGIFASKDAVIVGDRLRKMAMHGVTYETHPHLFDKC